MLYHGNCIVDLKGYKIRKNKLNKFTTQLSNTPGFLSRDVYQESVFQNQFSNMVLYEFSSFDTLTDTVFAAKFFELDTEVKDCFEDFAATLYQPPYEKGGSKLYGENYRAQMAGT